MKITLEGPAQECIAILAAIPGRTVAEIRGPYPSTNPGAVTFHAELMPLPPRRRGRPAARRDRNPDHGGIAVAMGWRPA